MILSQYDHQAVLNSNIRDDMSFYYSTLYFLGGTEFRGQSERTTRNILASVLWYECDLGGLSSRMLKSGLYRFTNINIRLKCILMM